MNTVEKAMLFAIEAHEGQTRKLHHTPYVLHPMEVANIISTITEEQDTIAAGLLHDTVEDTAVTYEQLLETFGQHVADLVMCETENKYRDIPPEESWMRRKRESLESLAKSEDINVKIMWLADKLSNARSYYRQYRVEGNGVWLKLHQKDPKMHEWYLKTIRDTVEPELGHTAAFAEFAELLDKIFPKEED